MPETTTKPNESIARFRGTVALALVAYAKDKFEPENNDWPATAWPRIAELLDDLQDGVVRQRTLQREHQTGVGTGRLRDSIHADVTDDGVMLSIGGGEVDYARRFIEGGSNTLRVPQRELRRWYRTKEGSDYIRQHALGWLFAKAEVSFTSPPRPIITDIDDVADLIASEAREAFGNSAEVSL